MYVKQSGLDIFLTERCNFIAMSDYCHDMLFVVVVVVWNASVL